MPSFIVFFVWYKKVVKRCTDGGVEGIFDIMELEDDKRNELLKVCNG